MGSGGRRLSISLLSVLRCSSNGYRNQGWRPRGPDDGSRMILPVRRYHFEDTILVLYRHVRYIFFIIVERCLNPRFDFSLTMYDDFPHSLFIVTWLLSFFSHRILRMKGFFTSQFALENVCYFFNFIVT